MKPATLDEAVRLLGEYGDRARVLAGGTDLVDWLRDDAVTPDMVVDVKGIADLQGIARDGDTMRIGALATFTDLLESALVTADLPLLAEMAATVGSVAIRNRATLAGNVCSAVACCDGGPVLLAHEAIVHTLGPDGRRAVPVEDWFVANRRTDLLPGEVVTHLSVPVPTGGHGGAWVKLSRYQGEDLAQASVAVVALPGGHWRVAFGAVAPTPVRSRRIEALLDGLAEPGEDLLAEARRLVDDEIAPITDVRATREYRLHMSKVMLARAVPVAAARQAGDGPPYGTPLI